MSVLKSRLNIETRNGSGICLIDLWFGVPVNSYGHVGMLPPLYGTFTHYKNVIAIIMRLKL